MVTNIKNKLLPILCLYFSFILSNSMINSTYNQSIFDNSELNINKINHNFNFSMGTQSDSFGSSSYYSIGDRVTYNFSEKFMFIGDFDLIFSSASYNQIDNNFNQPKLNFDLGFKYNFNENTNFQFRIIKNSLNPSYNSITF